MARVILYIDSTQMGRAQRVMNNLADYFIANNTVFLVNDIIPDPTEPEYPINDSIIRYYLDEGNPKGRYKNLYRIKRLREYIKKEKADVIISFLGPPNIRMILATIGLGLRKIVSVRNDPNVEYGKGVKKVFARKIFRLADGCVFQTEDAREYFPKKVRLKSKVIFNPVNEAFYQFKWIGDRPEIAVVGRLEVQKNPLLALKAFSHI